MLNAGQATIKARDIQNAQNLETQKLTLKTETIQALTDLGRDQVRKLVRDGIFPNVSGNSRRIIVPRVAVMRYLETAGQK